MSDDRAEKIPALKRALAINPELKLVGSPWSPPAWMKSSGSLIKGSLLPRFYSAFAEYFRRWIAAYEAEGLPIFAITLQNEPHFEPHWLVGPERLRNSGIP
jgi:glucosylceramidase